MKGCTPIKRESGLDESLHLDVGSCQEGKVLGGREAA